MVSVGESIQITDDEFRLLKILSYKNSVRIGEMKPALMSNKVYARSWYNLWNLGLVGKKFSNITEYISTERGHNVTKEREENLAREQEKLEEQMYHSSTAKPTDVQYV